MAAGKGSRYGALKQFDKLGPSGEFLFEYALYDAIQNGFDSLVIITRENYVVELHSYLTERIPSSIGLKVLPQRMDDIPLKLFDIDKRTKPWGTAHAVWTARHDISGPFAVMNADDYYGRSSFELAARFMQAEQESGDFGLVPFSLKDTLSEEGGVTRAICIVKNGYLQHIEECLSISYDSGGLRDGVSGRAFTGDEVTSMNFWIFTPKVFDLITDDLKAFLSDEKNRIKEELYIPSQAQKWISTHKAKVKLTDSCSDWFGVTYANDRDKAVHRLEELVSKGIYPNPLWS